VRPTLDLLVTSVLLPAVVIVDAYRRAIRQF
jgi:hypothetical protein